MSPQGQAQYKLCSLWLLNQKGQVKRDPPFSSHRPPPICATPYSEPGSQGRLGLETGGPEAGFLALLCFSPAGPQRV